MMSDQATTKMTRVLVVDDHPLVAHAIRDRLNASKAIDVVECVSTEADAIRAADRHRPEVIIVDLSLERGTGLGVIKAVSASHPEVGLLVYSMHDEELYAERAMRAGAHGYVSKSAGAEELLMAVKLVIRGELAVSSGMNRRLLNKALGHSDGSSGVPSLSDRELEVFEHIGRGMPLRQIAIELGISVKTVETHREKIKRKLDLGSATEVARYAVAWVENPN